MELAFPTPFAGGRSGTRIALFVDTGYVYENIDAFEADKLRGSFGLSVTWEAPIGPIVISYAFPFNDQEGDRTATPVSGIEKRGRMARFLSRLKSLLRWDAYHLSADSGHLSKNVNVLRI